ncbi:helix-turn-helix domain-containing protein [Stakelama tenebrarum]|uniref:Helix-turn-helix domain-containing protein n=1 Tax=Stakelama tenebrarum TaxID=2711215 RepID=A0A6G6Y826_9SPHN|nr:helix-turn-helix domain-containing protein [Sphingosinithalassobacter tenebrarum]QIG80726.1 helix-turn-helix domain-containing protein [Sphingosinithalassobacter tenebrarum]
MATVLDGNKAKTARRVIEVLEFFDDQRREVTVMDIVRRYNRPQSSTSELLASLVELGLLYKDPGSRSYTLTPRAAILGSITQPQMVRDGRLATLIDRLVAQTGLGVVLLGMVGLNAQVFRWSPGSKFSPGADTSLCSGAQEPLFESAGGRLLLSTLRADRRDGLIRRLNAEAAEDRKFSYAEMVRQVAEHGHDAHAVGPAGFDSDAQMVSVLLPVAPGEQPMAIGFVFQTNHEIDPQALIGLLDRSVQRCIRGSEGPMEPFEVVSSAA